MSFFSALFHAPAVRTPSVKYLKETAAKFGFDLTDDELKDYQGIGDYICLFKQQLSKL